MDSITQGVLGAAAAQAVLKKRLPQGAGLVGAIGGMAADLDILIRSSSDPTVSWLFHRHFTHSLIFIPIGGLIAALPFLFLKQYKDDKRWVILAAIIGYATHAPLDMFTSFGTQLFWPFSNYRVAFDWIGIVDPVYTLPLWIGVIWTARTGQMRPVRMALLLTSLYICFGGWQHHRGVEMQRQLAEIRGHQIEHARVMPLPGWLMLWRSVYTANGQLYADGFRLSWFGTPRVLEGGSADLTTFENLPASAQANAETRRRYEIFIWFADGLVSPMADESPAYNAFGDMRLTVEPESLVPLWGLQFDTATGEARRWSPSAGPGRDVRKALRDLVFGDARYRTLRALKDGDH